MNKIKRSRFFQMQIFLATTHLCNFTPYFLLFHTLLCSALAQASRPSSTTPSSTQAIPILALHNGSYNHVCVSVNNFGALLRHPTTHRQALPRLKPALARYRTHSFR